jgi:hypothetical protein
MFVFNLFENKEQEPKPGLPVVKEDSWHDGSTAWSSEHDQWAKESQGDTQLSVGDPIIVTAPNEYEGKTGEIAEFSPSGKFVVVNLYNHGEHSMHLSDVEYNKYADDEVDEGYASVIGLNPKSLDPVSQWKISVRQLVADYIKDPQSLYNLAKQKGSNSAEAMAYKYIMHPSGKIELPPDAMTNEQDVAENSDSSPVAGAITRRILMQRHDLLKQYGPELVGAAVDNVADYVGDVDEIGSSDVSAWVDQVERMLRDNPPEAFAEGELDEISRRDFLKGVGATAGLAALGAPKDAEAARYWSKDPITEKFTSSTNADNFRGAWLFTNEEGSGIWISLIEPTNMSLKALEQNRLHYPIITSPQYSMRFDQGQVYNGTGIVGSFPEKRDPRYKFYGISLVVNDPKTFKRIMDQEFLNAGKVHVRLQIDNQPYTLTFSTSHTQSGNKGFAPPTGLAEEEMDKENPPEAFAEGWSDAMVARRTGQPRTPYSVYIKGKKWKDFENDDHAEAVANKLRAKFKADGRDPSVITIAATDYEKDIKEMDKSQTPPGRAGDYPLGVKGTTGKPVTAKKVVKDLTKDLDQAFGKEKKVKEEAGRVDPILIKALNRMPDGLATHGEVLNACYDAYAMELGRMEMKSNYGTTHAYVPQLMDLYKQKHGLTFKETVLNPRDLAGDLAAKRKALQDLSMNKDVDQQAVQQRKLDLDREARAKGMAEEWSQKYKSSINCSHPKGFSQKAHCAGKKKHNESVDMEMVCEDCGMCETHGNVMEIKKGQQDSNGYTKCWSGYHAAGTKKSATTGKQVRNCVPNEGVAEAETDYTKRRDRERKVDAGQPVSRQPKNPQTDYAKKRAKEKRDLERFGESTNYWTRLQNERNTKVASLVNELTESVKDIK